MYKDMSSGNIYKLLIYFTIPLFIGNVFQQLYSMVDSIIVGRFVSIEALAAIGAVSGLSFMTVGFSSGIAQGFSVKISQSFGAKNYDKLKSIYAMSIVSGVIVTSIVSIVFCMLSRYLLLLLNTPENIFELANDYILIIFAGLIFSFFYNFFSSVFRAVGDSRTPFAILLISSVLNIVLDLVFVLFLEQGVSGVAFATVLSQFISAILSFSIIRIKYDFFHLQKKFFHIDIRLMLDLLRLGVPSALQYSVCAIGVLIVQFVLNGFGSDAIAAFSIGNKIENIFAQFYPALGMAISTFVGQNLGARKLQRIRLAFKNAVVICIGFSIIAMIIIFLSSKELAYIFVSDGISNESIIAMASFYARILSVFYIPLGFIFIFRSGCQGLGSGSVPLWSSLLELIFRLITAFTLPNVIGFIGICLAAPCAWLGTGMILPFIYNSYMRKIERNQS